jgi:hypothetical protein
MKVIKQFFIDNQPDEEFLLCVRASERLSKTAGYLEITQSSRQAIIEAIKLDAHATGNDLGWGSVPPYLTIELHGPHYTLLLWLTSGGFALGSDQQYALVNPSLAKAIEKVCEENGLLKGYNERLIKYLVKIGSGEDAEFPMPPEEERRR